MKQISKFALIPLMVLTLGLGACGSNKKPVVPPTPPEPTDPTWTEEQVAGMKDALGGNVLPYFAFDNGKMEFKSTTSGEGEEAVTVKVVEYTILPATEMIKDKYEDTMTKIGFEPTTTPGEYSLPLEKYYLGESIDLKVVGTTTPKGQYYVRGTYSYYCEEAVTKIPDELQDVFVELFGMPIPEPSNPYLTFGATTAGEDILLIFVGDNHLDDYAVDMVKAGYTVSKTKVQLKGEDGKPVVHDAYKGDFDYANLRLVAMYDEETKAMLVIVTMMPNVTWYPYDYAYEIKTVMGIENVYLPAPSLDLLNASIEYIPVDEKDETKGYYIAINAVTARPDVAFDFYAMDLINAGYKLMGKPTQSEETGIFAMFFDPVSLAIIGLAQTPDMMEFGQIVITVMGQASANPELAGNMIAYVNETLGVDTKLPVPTFPVLFGETAALKGNAGMIVSLYSSDLQAGVSYAKALKEAGYVMQGDGAGQDGYFTYTSQETGLTIKVGVDPENHLVSIVVLTPQPQPVE